MAETVSRGRGRHSSNEESPYLLGMYDPRNYIPWSTASIEKLADAEKRLLSIVKTPLEHKFIKVRLWNGSVHTIIACPENSAVSKKPPFVLIHDIFMGVAVWNQNFDALSKFRTTYAFDLLGWGRSSRPDFSSDATLAELEYVQAIEDWRKQMKIEKMILVGHGFGGYLCSSYALEHPSHVRHLVLTDPWGFVKKPVNEKLISAGHHAYADNSEEFNKFMAEISELVDLGEDQDRPRQV